MNGKKALGFVVAAAVVGMLAGGHQFAGETKKDSGKTVKCSGVNSCKGTSECKSAKNSCKGMNSCKGQGFVSMTKQACDDAKAKAKAAK